ncbi:MAG TPA: hypothetical protein VM869_20710, partial [Enhygromyxa sp.]|nr:hypothetical protein [Enhygromyxa sp.]
GIGSTMPHGTPEDLPSPITEVGGTIDTLACGVDHSCVITAAGDLRCWGNGAAGQLGYGNTQNVGDGPGEMPPPPVDVGGTPVLVSLGDQHSCVVLDNGETRCWGYNHAGQLGYGHTETIGDEPGEMPPPAVNVGGTPIQLALGYGYTCALLDTGKVRCWGRNHVAQLGQGHTNDVGDNPGEMPPPDTNLGPNPVTQVDVSVARGCARFDNGTVRCWGTGILGYGNLLDMIGDSPADMPPPVINLAGNAIEVEVGGSHSCALFSTNNVRCWGDNDNGELGTGDNFNDIGDDPGEMPPADVEVGGLATQLGVGVGQSCALTQSNEVRCWGTAYANGQSETLGDDPGEMPPPPVIVY